MTLGLGIIGIGKRWGHAGGEVPSEPDALELLEFAWEIGIRYFDSAPSYGVAEERLGKFLRSLTAEQRAEIQIATKFGEHWDAAREEPFVDHSFPALRRSLEASLLQLGRIDFLQLHKTSPEALRSEDVARAWELAGQCGVGRIGASVSDLESAEMVLADSRLRCIQLPLNAANPKFSHIVRRAANRDDLWVATNRPFAMGAMLYGEHPVSHADAFRSVLSHRFNGVVLTGTKSKQHLRENWDAFHSVTI